MDFSTGLNIASILVSIGIGFGTFYIADRRARRNQWEAARDTILRDLSKSLGEGRVPPAGVIQATINSVLRRQSASDLSVISVEQIADDLLRHVTADPFLDPDRRVRLQGEILALKVIEPGEPPEIAAGQEPRDGEFEKRIQERFSSLAVMAGVTASLFAALGLPLMFRFLDWLKAAAGERTLSYIPVVSVILTVLSALFFYFVEYRGRLGRK